jgi:ubiquinone/menaquinone biosynthesis C-methylase UbiE
MRDQHSHIGNRLMPGHRNMPGMFTGRSSRNYDRAAQWLLPRVYRRLAGDVAATVSDGAHVLDVGTGPGILPRELLRRRPDLTVTGVDMSADMIAAAARNLAPFGERATAVVGDVADLPFADDSFVVIVSSLSLHHWDGVDAAAPELARVVRRGGHVLVYDLSFAPFDELTQAGRSLFTSSARSPVRAGVPFLRWERLTLTR